MIRIATIHCKHLAIIYCSFIIIVDTWFVAVVGSRCVAGDDRGFIVVVGKRFDDVIVDRRCMNVIVNVTSRLKVVADLSMNMDVSSRFITPVINFFKVRFLERANDWVH